MSQGALFKHFRTKAHLLGAAVRRLFDGLIRDFREAFAAADTRADRVTVALGQIRQAFAEPRLLAAFELYAAARTDTGLRRALAPVMAEHRANLRAEARGLFTELVDPAQLDSVVDCVMSAFQGEALGRLVLREPGAEARSFALLERMVRGELDRGREGRSQRGRRRRRSGV